MVDRKPRIINRWMQHARWVALRRPAKIVHSVRMFALPVDLVDRDDLARLWLGQQVVVMKAPPGRRVAAECATEEPGICAGAQPDVENTKLDHIARLSVCDRDRPGAQVDAEPFAGATPENRCIHWAGAAPIDILSLPGPVEDAFSAGIAF